MLRVFGRVAIVVVVAAFAFGVVHGWHSPPSSVDRNQTHWQATRPARYAFVFSRGGMSGECRLAVSVRDAKVTGAHVLRTCGWSLDPKHAPTIDDVFSQVRAAYRHGGKVVVTYDPRYRFPTSVSVDPEPRAIDDEWGFAIRSFRAS